jgi:hypothetical protein
MYGVVLWKDTEGNRAVIWCEDQGDLAFLSAEEGLHSGANLDAGDLIHFDVIWDGALRRANNAKLVASEAFPTLPKDLAACSAALRQPEDHPGACDRPNVVSFPATRQADAPRHELAPPVVAGRKVV